MNILVTGSDGQLGQCFKWYAETCLHPLSQEVHYFFTNRSTLDITNYDAVKNYVKYNSIDVIINCAAYTNVDKAEEDERSAIILNGIAVQNLALIAKEFNAKLIHFSTDYVFDGNKNTPYTETDPTNAISAYGKSKVLGEDYIQKVEGLQYMIFRISWLYSIYGNNFFTKMVKLGKENSKLNVVYDQIGAPTYGYELAKTVMHILLYKDEFISGIYNYSGSGVISWYDFATAIFDLMRIDCEIIPLLSSEYNSIAPRPHYSVLDHSKIVNTYNSIPNHWYYSLKWCVEHYNNLNII